MDHRRQARAPHRSTVPRNAPTRTAIGAAGVTFYAVLWAAAASDIIATHFQLTMEGVILRPAGALFSRPVHRLLRDEAHLPWHCRRRTARSRCTATSPVASCACRGGEFIEVHEPLDEYERWKLVGFESPSPLPAVPNEHGVVDRKERRRAKLSRWFFEDRVAPVTPTELEAAHGHHGGHEAIEAADTQKTLSH